jgi:hypothetical protein
MSKGMIGFIIVAVVGLSALLIIQMKRSAADAEKRSGNIMEKFKMIDKDLQKTKTNMIP